MWFVPRAGAGTLTRGDNPYLLTNATLGEDFHKDLRLQLTAFALSSAALAANTAARDRVLSRELSSVTTKIVQLIENGTIIDELDRSNLYKALGTAFAVLGDREGGARRILQAIDAYNKALEVFTPERMPFEWASTQHNLGAALTHLGKLENNGQRFELAIDAYSKALEIFTFEQTPMKWTATQNNLEKILTISGEFENNPQHIADGRAILSKILKDAPENSVR